jgi:hypothetical protein
MDLFIGWWSGKTVLPDRYRLEEFRAETNSYDATEGFRQTRTKVGALKCRHRRGV